eukprot:scaffold29689_cov72-Skeletonema_dohrnii-CCMP3373.AAC.1
MEDIAKKNLCSSPLACALALLRPKADVDVSVRQRTADKTADRSDRASRRRTSTKHPDPVSSTCIAYLSHRPHQRSSSLEILQPNICQS